jgi:hypothetical protein
MSDHVGPTSPSAVPYPPPPWTQDEPHNVTIERVLRLAFDGDRPRFAAFLDQLRSVIPADAAVILRGSAVTGTRWADGLPFDADGQGTSDLDVTFVGGALLRRWDAFYIPGLHTVPLSDEHPDACAEFRPLRKTLCEIAGRPVNLQATSSLVQYVRDVVFDQPYVTLIDKDDDTEGATDAPTETDGPP